jgi:ABC-type multidrug transport system ATPase subunit
MLDAEKLLELFLTKPTVQDKKHAFDLKLNTGVIEFEHVHFCYDPRKEILNDITFRAEPGKTIAFVGETGGGKSTILKLLFRFYDCTKGAVKIDGHDVRDLTLTSLRENMGVVPQDPTLFNDTIISNIRYANLGATDKEVYDACKAAVIHDKIMSFPDGYNSKVGERGVKLSGGELQRVSIARAILKNPKIILLDEATSMVDMDTESKIQDALRKLTKDRTTFVVAHRLSTVMNADTIIVIKDGKIAEQGTHAELFHSKGKYYKLWSKQIIVGEASKSKSGRQPAILNDLSSDAKRQHLLEAVQAAERITDCSHGSDTQGSPDSDTQGNTSDEIGPSDSTSNNVPAPAKGAKGKGKDMTGHNSATSGDPTTSQSAVSKDGALRPDAPEYIPSNRAFKSTGSLAEAKKIDKNQKKLEDTGRKAQIKAEKEAKKLEEVAIKARLKAEKEHQKAKDKGASAGKTTVHGSSESRVGIDTDRKAVTTTKSEPSDQKASKYPAFLHSVFGKGESSEAVDAAEPSHSHEVSGTNTDHSAQKDDGGELLPRIYL